jgi:hypothetical protein
MPGPDFEAISLTPGDAGRLQPVLAAAGEMLEARPGSLCVIVEFETWRDAEDGPRAHAFWSLLWPGGQCLAPEIDVIEVELWAHCWAIQRLPWPLFLSELLNRPGQARREPRRPPDPFAGLSEMAVLLWPEAALLLDDKLGLLGGQGLPGCTIRPLVSERDRENAAYAARLLARLGQAFPQLGTGEGPYDRG